MASEQIKAGEELIDKIFDAIQLMILKEFTEKEEANEE